MVNRGKLYFWFKIVKQKWITLINKGFLNCFLLMSNLSSSSNFRLPTILLLSPQLVTNGKISHQEKLLNDFCFIYGVYMFQN